MHRAVAGLLLALLAGRESYAVDCRQDVAARQTVCRVDLEREELRLAYADAQGRRYEEFASLRAGLRGAGRDLAFAMNAGMFHPDFRPVGLLAIDGLEISPINRAAGTGNFFVQPNGVFVIDAAGARVLATDEYHGLQPRFATQSGPLLVHRGSIPASSVFRAGSKSRHVRNGLCAPSPRQVLLVISDAPVTFGEFAQYFRDTLGCSEALYLDGTISSLFSPALGRADHHARLGPMLYIDAPARR